MAEQAFPCDFVSGVKKIPANPNKKQQIQVEFTKCTSATGEMHICNRDSIPNERNILATKQVKPKRKLVDEASAPLL